MNKYNNYEDILLKETMKNLIFDPKNPFKIRVLNIKSEAKNDSTNELNMIKSNANKIVKNMIESSNLIIKEEDSVKEINKSVSLDELNGNSASEFNNIF